MPKTDDTPDPVKPYVAHGLDLTDEGGEWRGECPWCDKPKLHVNAETGLWNCFTCATGGNALLFLRRLWETGTVPSDRLNDLSVDRKVRAESLMAWGVVASPVTGEWLVPGWNVSGKLVQLYRYVSIGSHGSTSTNGGKVRRLLLPTPTLDHGFLSPTTLDVVHRKDLLEVYVCEGPWDAVALWELMGTTKRTASGYLPTSSTSSSLLAQGAVMAAPTCSVFNPKWKELFGGREVTLLYDSDHPNPKTQDATPAGYAGARRAAGIIASAAELPSGLRYLPWGKDGYDPRLPSGYDVRDHLNNGVGKLTALKQLLERLLPIPKDWVEGRSKEAVAKGKVELQTLPCRDWGVLVQAWDKAMVWDWGLEKTLAVMLSVVVSTDTPDDQLWVRVLSPPSTGKTTLSEALSVCRRYIKPLDTFSGLTSGYQSDKEGSENLSPIEKMRGKTVIVNDGDTLLQLPNLPQILSQLRAFFGRNLRSSYRNKMSADFEGYNTTFVVCGTESLRQLDTSELGERMLTCTLMERIDDARESAIAVKGMTNLAVMMRSCRGEESAESEGARLLHAKQLTGGYVAHLRENYSELLSAISDSNDASVISTCEKLAALVAYLRARPSTRQKEKAQREMSSRLSKQLFKLAMCSAAVMNRPTIDEPCMRIVRAVATDTASGRTMALVHELWRYDARGGTNVSAMATVTGHDEKEESALIKHLGRIGAVRRVPPPGGVNGIYYRLTPRMLELYAAVVQDRTDGIG